MIQMIESSDEITGIEYEQSKIIHIDMDCFYAAVEMQDNPKLKKIPIAVGGQAKNRGVIATCNYPAREYGVRSAMSSAYALRLCPELKILPPRMDTYREISAGIFTIFYQFTDLVEPLSLDEAYLEVTACTQFKGSATLMAKNIRKQIRDKFNLTASAGIAANKFLAKVASDWQKPDGLFTIEPEKVDEFVKTLSVKVIPGVGKVTADKLQQFGIHTCGDLQSFSREQLKHHFGSFGLRLYDLCRGVDNREVLIGRQRKSLSVEETFAQDLPDLDAIIALLPSLVAKLDKRYQRISNQSLIKGLFVKLKFNNFVQTTVERKTEQFSHELLLKLCKEAYLRGEKPVRLVGIGYRFKCSDDDHEPIQLGFDL